MASIALPLLGSLIPGLAGLFGGGKQQTINTNQTTTGSQSGSQESSGYGTTTPQLSLIQQLLSNIGGISALNMLQQGPTDLKGYEAGGLQQINQAGDIQKKLSQNILASRGLSSSPYAAYAEMQPEMNRTQQQSQFLAGIPLLQRQMQSEDINRLFQAFGATGPFGSSSTSGGQQQYNQNSTSNTQGTNVVSGNPAGGFASGFGAGLINNFPQLMGNFGYQPQQYQPGGNKWQGPIQPGVNP